MGFSDILVRYLILLEGYKLFDMVCFDYILLTKLNIFQKLFPETVGCKGYEKFGFNLKSQIIKILVFAVISVVIAVVLSRCCRDTELSSGYRRFSSGSKSGWHVFRQSGVL